MLYEIDSRKTIESIDASLREAATRHKFGVLGVHDLRATMQSKGVVFDTPVYVYEVCNPHQAQKVLSAMPAVSAALPCRISVYGTPEGYRISTMRPTQMMAAFGVSALEPIAKEVEDTLLAMINESA